MCFTATLDMWDRFPQSDPRNKKSQTINNHYQEVEVEERFDEDHALLEVSRQLLSPNFNQ